MGKRRVIAVFFFAAQINKTRLVGGHVEYFHGRIKVKTRLLIFFILCNNNTTPERDGRK